MKEKKSIRELIDQGILVEPKYYAPKIGSLELKKVKDDPRDNGRTKIDNVVEQYKKIAGGSKCLVFGSCLGELRKLVSLFRLHGYAFDYIDAQTSFRDACGKINLLIDNKVEGLVLSDRLDKLDLPGVDCIIILSEARSKSHYLQMMNPVLKSEEDGRVSIVLDHANNIARHGYPFI